MSSLRTTTLSIAVAAMTMAASAAFAAEPPSPRPLAARRRRQWSRRSTWRGCMASTTAPASRRRRRPAMRAQAVAEAMHLKKAHGNVDDSADQRLEFDHPNH